MNLEINLRNSNSLTGKLKSCSIYATPRPILPSHERTPPVKLLDVAAISDSDTEIENQTDTTSTNVNNPGCTLP
ncbi:uncharacterized protein RSE6_04662 [Rhynchosporium secalis]|uniref:Uncharacterized protein n=1 Tax=Rhynchosporium secalis TaxID=38038 RepID=A0A1E1M5V9_RHYSE|nr:uncharacterized protein RSE6_04662 [Rhynchosporium secalis]